MKSCSIMLKPERRRSVCKNFSGQVTIKNCWSKYPTSQNAGLDIYFPVSEMVTLASTEDFPKTIIYYYEDFIRWSGSPSHKFYIWWFVSFILFCNYCNPCNLHCKIRKIHLYVQKSIFLLFSSKGEYPLLTNFVFLS